MKKNLFAVIGIALGIFPYTACSNELEFEEALTPQNSITDNHSKHPENWKEEIQYAMNRHHSKRTVEPDIRLIDYTYKGTINTTKDISMIKEKLCGNDVFTVFYTSSNPMGFEIKTIGEIREFCSRQGIPMQLDAVAKQIDDTLHVGMEVIEVTWVHNGKEYISTAIAEKNGLIIYEPIGQYLYEIGNIEENNKVQNEEKTFPRIKTAGESSNNETQYRTLEFNIKGDVNAQTFYARPVMTYDIMCSSTFSVNDGILRGKDMVSHYNTIFGWSGNADCRTVEGTIDKNLFHNFAWGYGCMNGAAMTLSFSGASFTLCSGAQGSTGCSTHRIK